MTVTRSGAAARRPPAADGVLDRLLSRRLLFVAGKGGTGKSTLAAALALVASRRGRRVLCIEEDAKGDLAGALGSAPVAFEPRVVQPNVSCLQMHAEESLQEYLRIYFKVPRFTRLTPLARIFDFVAKGVPGAKDMLVVGKIAFEEKRTEAGRPRWDLIVVDTEATGHILPQLNAARAMLDLAKGGIIRSQAEWVDAIIADPRRTALTICTLPEEMPVTEAVELHDRARKRTRIALGACFLNRAFDAAVTERQLAVLEAAARPEHAEAARERLGGELAPMVEGVRLARRLAAETQRHLRVLRSQMTCPIVEVPLQVGARSGLATTRQVARALTERGG